MENNMGDYWEQNKNIIVNELTMGRELARQLQMNLNNAPSSSRESREMLVQKILASYEKALSVLNLSSSSSIIRDSYPTGVAIGMSESPLSGSPRSEDSDRDLKDQQDPKDATRKRKSTLRWTQQVRVSPGMGLEGPLDDGFSWRKYGQKDILGAKYPRGYYRCTHRIVQGCLATKQVQRSDEDPTIFEITYRGRHTCTQASNMQLDLSPSVHPPPEKQEPKNTQLQEINDQQDLLLNFRSELKVVTEGLDGSHGQTFPSFHFHSTSDNVNAPSVVDNSLMGSYAPSFISPSTSGTNYNFSAASSSGLLHNSFQTSESTELTDIISAATSATNSPTVGLDFPFGNVQFDPNFNFDNFRQL